VESVEEVVDKIKVLAWRWYLGRLTKNPLLLLQMFVGSIDLSVKGRKFAVSNSWDRCIVGLLSSDQIASTVSILPTVWSFCFAVLNS